MLERRSFLISCGCMVAALAAPEIEAHELPPIGLPSKPCKTAVVLRVQGWDAPQSEEGTGDVIWISMDRSWRSAWR